MEAAASPGGAVKTLELTEPGFRHDWAAMNLSMFAGSAFHATYAADLAAQGLEFVAAQNCFASVFRDGTHLGVSSDLTITNAKIAELSPVDAKAWAEMLSDFERNAPHIFRLAGFADAVTGRSEDSLEGLPGARYG